MEELKEKLKDSLVTIINNMYYHYVYDPYKDEYKSFKDWLLRDWRGNPTKLSKILWSQAELDLEEDDEISEEIIKLAKSQGYEVYDLDNSEFWERNFPDILKEIEKYIEEYEGENNEN